MGCLLGCRGVGVSGCCGSACNTLGNAISADTAGSPCPDPNLGVFCLLMRWLRLPSGSLGRLTHSGGWGGLRLCGWDVLKQTYRISDIFSCGSPWSRGQSIVKVDFRRIDFSLRHHHHGTTSKCKRCYSWLPHSPRDSQTLISAALGTPAGTECGAIVKLS